MQNVFQLPLENVHYTALSILGLWFCNKLR